MIIIDVFLPLDQDIDTEAERLAKAMGAQFVRGAMVAQLVRLEFAPLVRYRVTASRGLRVRDKPSVTAGRVLGVLPFGDIVTVVETAGDWALHDSALGRGWSAAEFLEEADK